MTLYFHDYEAAAKEIVKHVGKTIVIGVPLGLGKPIGLLNALYRLARADSSINLTIVTALTFSRPPLKNKLEKNFVEPILDRILKNYEDPLYEKDRELQQLPNNIKVIEFFLLPGKFLHNASVQQNYISSTYSNVVRDLISLSINVLAQQVAPPNAHSNSFSVSCNTDLFHGVQEYLKQAECAGKKVAVVAEVNGHLPFMYGEQAEVNDDIFSYIVDTKNYRSLFAVPRDELSMHDHLIGLYTSCLIKDDSCLQIGIGTLSNALANALIMRHKSNGAYTDLLRQLNVQADGSIFDKGLYASTEMFGDEYMQLYKAGILKKTVYDHVGLQTLLNAKKISSTITPDFIDVLRDNKIISQELTPEDVQFLQKFGILTKDKICRIGSQLQSGKIAHAGFFFGSTDFYTQLRNLPYEESQTIEMTSIARTNSLSWSPELLKLQRQHARFVNSSLMVTLLGTVISDGLKDYQEVSGVGGQYDFVSMASQLPDARSIINCRSTRETKNGIESNIVWEYSNSTLPRYLRDIIITEYGIADCRSKTDADVIKAILNITDSRFQSDLLNKAKKAGKIERNYQIPALYQNNCPESLEKIMRKFQAEGYFKPYPFGSDLTHEEEILARALLYLKKCSTLKLCFLIIRALFFFPDNKKVELYLQRMQLQHPKNVSDYVYKKLIAYVIRF